MLYGANEMKIGYIYYSRYKKEKAHPIQILETCNALAQTGYEVTLCTPQNIDHIFEYHDVDNKFKIYNIQGSGSASKLDRIRYYFMSLQKVKDLDVIYSRDILFLKFLYWTKILSHPPILYEAHEVYHNTAHLNRKEEKEYIDISDKVIAISKGVKDDLISLGINVEDTVTVGVRSQNIPKISKKELRKKHSIPQNTVTMVYAGNLEKWKNDIDLVLRSVRYVARNVDNSVYLLIIGGNKNQQQRIEEKISQYNINSNVELVGHVPHKDVFEYLKLSDIGIAPLKDVNEWNKKYTSPVKIHEYLACGLSVIASNVEAVSSNFGHIDDVHLYTVGNADSFSNCIQQYLEESAEKVSSNKIKNSFKNRAKKLDSIIKMYI